MNRDHSFQYRQIEREADRHEGRQTEEQTDGQKYSRRGRQIDRKIDRQEGRWKDKQADRQID